VYRVQLFITFRHDTPPGVAASSTSYILLSSSLWRLSLVAVAAACTHPLDLTKVRMQTVQSTPGAQPSMLQVLRKTIAKDGVRSLFTGLSASMMRQMSYSLVRIGTYEKAKQKLAQKGKPSSTSLLTAAALCGGLGGIAGNPAGVFTVLTGENCSRTAVSRHSIGANDE
jgi:solute carrier family 25 (mitochondrial dicarboxylate transporter), member 10